MNFRQWLTIIESLDPNIEIKLRNFINNPKNPQDKKTQAEDELNRMKSDPNPFDNATAFANINAIFGIQNKDKPTSQVDAFRKNWQDRGSTEEELKTYDYFKSQNQTNQSLTEMMELLEKFIDKKLITIKFENNKPVLMRNTLQGEQKLDTPDFTRFMSQLHGIESSLTQYSGKGNYFNPVENEKKYEQYLTKGDNVWVYRGDTPDLCRIFGKNHKWCVSSSQSETYWFGYRIRHHQTQYFVFDFNKDKDDPARYVNPGVAPEGMYSEWVDAENQHSPDPEDPNSNSEVGINGYKSINEYKRYLASKGIPLNIWKTTPSEDWEKRLHYYLVSTEEDSWEDQQNKYFSRAKNDPDPRVFPMYLKIISKMNDKNFDSLDDSQKTEFVNGKIFELTKKQWQYGKNVKGYYNKLQNIKEKMIFAIRTNNIKLLEQLIEKGAYIRDQAACYYAAESGHLDILKYLVEKGAHIHNDEVIIAIENGHLDIVKYLVEEKGAEIRYDAVRLAAKNGHLDIVKYLVEKGAYISNEVIIAIENGHLDIVKYLLGDEVELNGEKIKLPENINKGKIGNAIFLAAENGYLDIVKYLVGKGAKFGSDEIEKAYENNHLDIVEYLEKQKKYLEKQKLDDFADDFLKNLEKKKKI